MRKALLVALTLAACSNAPSGAEGTLSVALEESASAAGVPRDVLVAIAIVEDGLDMPAHRNVDVDADVPAAGPLMLRRGKLDTLARGAALAHESEIVLRQDTDLALHAGALVLREVGDATGAKLGDVTSWQNAIEEMSGYADTAHRTHYAHRVFSVLARGGTFDGRDGERIVLPSHDDIPPSLILDVSSDLHILAPKSDYVDAEWIPTSCTNKCDTDRSGAKVSFVVIHDTEGGWDASVATLQNDPGKSVQYIVGKDGRVGQFVPESYTAWHAGNYYYNQRSVGIEHVGYYNKPFPNDEYLASAKLVSYLTEKYAIAKDRAHIIGHDQIPNGNVIASSAPACPDSPKTCETGSKYGGSNNHRDPGIWEWCTYMARFGGACKCNDVTNVLNCSEDKTQAFRCKAGNVELLTCNGPKTCTVMPDGVDDVCDQSAAPPKPNPGPPFTTGPSMDPPLSTARVGGGCSIASDAKSSPFWALGLLALVSRRRRVRS